MTDQLTRRGRSGLVGLRRIEQMKAHEYVAEQLRRQISLRMVPPGEALPSERALVGLFGVGRPTVQQAIRLLEAEGLVERRRGRSGGTFVRPGGQGQGPAGLLDALRRDRALIEQALDFRAAIEPAAAALAATRATAEQLAALDALAQAVAQEEDDALFEKLDTELHMQIALAAGNAFIAEGVERVRMHLNGALTALPDSALWHERSANEHAALMSGIHAREPELARAAMQVHIAHTEQGIRTLLASL
jgi:DNA-binding FadR family transcriptional regulator